MLVSARAPTRLLNTVSYSPVTHNADAKTRNYRNNIIKETIPNENIIKITKTIQNQIEKIKPSRFNQDTEVGSYITRLPPKMIYDHAMQMLSCNDSQVKDWALYLLFKSAEKGSLEALTKLGMLVLDEKSELNKNSKCESRIGIALLNKAAKHKHLEALKGLGFHHLKGNGVKQDIKQAEKYYMEAHDIGNNNAFEHVKFIRNEIMRSPNPQKAALELTLKE